MAAILGCFFSQQVKRRTAILSQTLLTMTMKYGLYEPRTTERQQKRLMCTVARAFCPQIPAAF